jgi:hypothetical protein
LENDIKEILNPKNQKEDGKTSAIEVPKSALEKMRTKEQVDDPKSLVGWIDPQSQSVGSTGGIAASKNTGFNKT